MRNVRVGKLPVGVLVAGVLAAGYALWGVETLLPGRANAAVVTPSQPETPVCKLRAPVQEKCDS